MWFWRKLKICKILSKLREEDLKILIDHGKLKVQGILDSIFLREMWSWSGYFIRHKTTIQCAGRKEVFFPNAATEVATFVF